MPWLVCLQDRLARARSAPSETRWTRPWSAHRTGRQYAASVANQPAVRTATIVLSGGPRAGSRNDRSTLNSSAIET
jgi:hypothetical protein